MRPAQIIASNLAALPHPDGGTRHLPGFNAGLLPDPMREQVTRAADEIGEAIVHLLETSGYRVTDAPAAPAPADDAPAVGHLHCRDCDTRLLSLNLSSPEYIVTSGRALIAALSQLSSECPHDARV